MGLRGENGGLPTQEDTARGSCCCLSLRVLEGPRDGEQQVESVWRPTGHPNGPHEIGHIGKDLSHAGLGAQGRRCGPAQDAAAGQWPWAWKQAITHPSQKGTARSAGSQALGRALSWGPEVSQRGHFASPTTLAFSREGFSLCGEGQLQSTHS